MAEVFLCYNQDMTLRSSVVIVTDTPTNIGEAIAKAIFERLEAEVIRQ